MAEINEFRCLDSDFDKEDFTAEEIAESDRQAACSISAIGRSWEDVKKEFFTPEEIAASKLRVTRIIERIKRRQEKSRL